MSETKNRFRITSIIIACLMLIGVVGILIGPFTINVSAAPDTHTWDGGGSGNLASDDDNWDTTAPDTGDVVVFNTGSKGCTWDIAKTFAAFYVNSTYTGTITVAAATSWGTTGDIITAAGSTFTSVTTSWITCGGSISFGGTLTTAVLRLNMTGTGESISALPASAYSLRISGTTTLNAIGSVTNSLIVDPEATLTIANSKDMYIYAGYIGHMATISNLGAISGPGELIFNAGGTNQTLTGLGMINAPVIMQSSGGDSSSYILGEDTTGMTSSLLIQSVDAINSFTLDTSASNYALTAGNITIGTRGIFNARGSTIICGGNWDSSVGTFISGTSIVVTDSVNNAWIDFLGSLTFTRESTNPLLEHDTIWEGTELADYQIVEEPSELRIYYSGLGGAPDGFGLATSPKVYPPIEWTKQGQVFAPNPIPGQWDSHRVRLGSVLKVDSTYYMYYMGMSAPAGTIKIGLATSSDGLTWARQGIVLSDGYCDTPAVIYMGPGNWLMYYSHRHSAYDCEIKLATSSNGLTWTQIGVVLTNGATGEWDQTYIEHVNINYIGGHYVLLYEAYNGTVLLPSQTQMGDGRWQLGIAYSMNPVSGFVKYPGNPIFSGSGTPGSFDQYQVDTPIFFYHEDAGIGFYYMFYGGNPNANWTISDWNMGLAYSSNITLPKTITSNEIMKLSTNDDVYLEFAPLTGQNVILTDLVLTPSQMQWSIISTSQITFTLSGLDSGLGYKVYVDGEFLAIGYGPSFSFSYSGPWSEHEFEVVVWYSAGVSRLVTLGYYMLVLGVLISIIAAVIAPLRNEKHFSPEKIQRTVINIVIFAVIAMTLLGVVHKVIYG